MNYWLYIGALAGYLALLFTTPIRLSLRDGWRALRRYPRLWITLGLFGFAYSLFDLGLRLYFYWTMPAGAGPLFVWARSAFRPDWTWFEGLRDSFWYLPPHAIRDAGKAAMLPALDSTAGVFNASVSTFPISAIAALALLLNFGGHRAVLFRAIQKRFPRAALFVFAGVLITALAAILKPLLFVLPRFVDVNLWYRWAPVAAWLSFLFEYMFGIYVQVFLILLAYCWVRGISFDGRRLLDFAIRRSSLVLRWAGVVMALSTALIDFPLILKNFHAPGFPDDTSTVEHRHAIARLGLDLILFAFCTTQITLTFHSESLRAAIRAHFRMIGQNPVALAWFFISAAVNFYLLQLAGAVLEKGFGEATAAWVVFRLSFPWANGVLAAWLLASWVCIYRRSDDGRAHDEEWIQF